MSKKYEYLLFDLDGTITDSYEAISRSYKYALEYYGIHTAPDEDLSFILGPPLKDTFEEHYGMSPDQADEAVEKYRERYHKYFLIEHKIYDGIPKLLEKLQNDGFKLVLATAKPEEFAKQILMHFNLEKYFYGIYGASFDVSRNSKEKVLDYIFENLDIKDRDKSVMIGDRKFDMEGARYKGIDAIGVSYGFAKPGELEAYNPVFIAKNCDELYNFLTED